MLFLSVPAVVGTNMVSSWVAGSTRVGSYWAGMFVTPVAARSVSQLGCYVWPGDTGNTTVVLVDQTNGTVVATTTINMSATPDGRGFVYATCAPVTLVAGRQYALAADASVMAQWSNQDTAISLTADFTAGTGCYQSSGGTGSGTYIPNGGVGGMYVGVDLIYV